jgi:hypothetical protein
MAALRNHLQKNKSHLWDHATCIIYYDNKYDVEIDREYLNWHIRRCAAIHQLAYSKNPRNPKNKG